MGLFAALFGAPRCYCGSGLERGFCSHRGATAAGTTANGVRTSGGSRLSRQATGAPAAGRKRSR